MTRKNYPSDICKLNEWTKAYHKTDFLAEYRIRLRENGNFDIETGARTWLRLAWPEQGFPEEETVYVPTSVTENISVSYVDAEFWMKPIELKL